MFAFSVLPKSLKLALHDEVGHHLAIIERVVLITTKLILIIELVVMRLAFKDLLEVESRGDTLAQVVAVVSEASLLAPVQVGFDFKVVVNFLERLLFSVFDRVKQASLILIATAR